MPNPTSTPTGVRSAAWVLAGAMAGAFALFFVYYSVRLATVWSSRSNVPRPAGMYVGAVVFPLLALGGGLAARGCFRRWRGRVRGS